MGGKSINIFMEISVLLFLLASYWKLNANIHFSETDVANELKHWRLDGSDDDLRFIYFLFCWLNVNYCWFSVSRHSK